MVGGGAALAVGQTGEWHHTGLVGDGVGDFDRIAHGIDGRVAGQAVVVDANGTPHTEFEACGRGQITLGADTDRKYDQVGGHRSGVGQDDRGVVDLSGTDSQAHIDPCPGEFGLDRPRHLGIQRGEDLVGQVDQRHLHPAVDERLGHLEADESGPEDDGRPGAAVDQSGDGVDVGNVAQHVGSGFDRRQVEPGDGRDDRGCTGAQHQDVVGLGGLGVVRSPHSDGLGLAVDAGDLVPDPHVEFERCGKGLGGVQKEIVAFGDLAGHVVRQAAVGERYVGVALEHDDLGGFVQASRPGRETHPAGDAADHKNPHALRQSSSAAAVADESWVNCAHLCASSTSPIAAAACANSPRQRRKPWLGACSQGIGPWPFHPLRRSASRPRWYPTRAKAYHSRSWSPAFASAATAAHAALDVGCNRATSRGGVP